ncbi:hypothetical protein FAES_1840 [Fibrella aestuarina BUZ 2]|uniref:Uncharacterized protein n=1 Tax=Fibrella aestuarina BUZ 2 TaxID=1166018 RepID=I0K6U7_9BACT|nr:hypothetical protein [Fibrella aestuarina]CCG99850.1 hypothetical protein FAES_1840 [Fibrella aestuarina BUZ 2]
MHPNFKDALERGYLEVAKWPDGGPIIIEGATYYLPTDSGANLFIKRFHAITDMVRKHNELGLSDEVLTTAFATIIDLNKQSLRQMLRGDGQEPDTSANTEIEVIIKRLQVRKELGLDIAMIYELATLYCMSEDEDPTDYDTAHNRKKQAIWSQKPEMFPFFAKQPWNKFLNLSKLLQADMKSVSWLGNLADQNTEEWLDLKRILLQRESLGLTPETMNIIGLRMETLQNYDGLLHALLGTTTGI